MKLYTYLSLDDDSQWNQLWDLATFLNVKEDKSVAIKYVLYGLGDFYVEVQYHIDNNKIVSKNAFKCGSNLDKHLSQINSF